MKLLMHICCGPCGTYSAKKSMEEHDVTLYWHNPNIHPLAEHERRLESGKIVAAKLGIPMIIDELEPEGWLNSIKGLENEPEGGKRCTVCFALRLRQTAKYAKEHGFEAITTTMTISPHKNAELINKIGKKHAEAFGVKWIESNFKKEDGFKKSIDMSKEMGLYRQKYCGCFYSIPLKRSMASPKEKNL